MKVESNAANIVMPKPGEASGSAKLASAATNHGAQGAKDSSPTKHVVKSASMSSGKVESGIRMAKPSRAHSFDVSDAGSGKDPVDRLQKQINQLDRQIREKTESLKAKGDDYDAGDLTDLQQDMQRRVELQTMLTKILQMEHEMRMAIINALPSGR